MSYLFPNGLTSPPIVTSGWHGYPGHNGVDSINHPGGYNWAIAEGVVIYAGYNPSGAGNEVRVQADDGNTYRALHHARIDVAVGQRVHLRTVLGVQGATGDATGIHCHTEIWVGGSIAGRLDPWPYIAARLPTPVPPIKRKNSMATVYRRGSSPDAYFALAGDSPGTKANWITTRNADLWGGWTAVHGPYIMLSEADYDLFADLYQHSTVATGDVTVESDPKLLAAVVALGPKIDALPKAIDEYSDGKKNS